VKDDFVPFSTSGNTMSDAAVTEHQGVSSSTLSHFRKKRARYIRDLIDAIHAEKGSCSILDIGGIEDYWNVVGIEYLNSKNVRIELINMEKHPPPRDTSIFSVQRGDGCSLPYHDNSFDLVHSNSVIEHVGDWTHKVAFSTECRRISPRYYVQTPNF